MLDFIGCLHTILYLMEFTTILEFFDFSMVCVANRYRCYPSVTLTVTPLTYLLTYTYKVKVSKGNKVTQNNTYHARGALRGVSEILYMYLLPALPRYVFCNYNNAKHLDRNTSRYC